MSDGEIVSKIKRRGVSHWAVGWRRFKRSKTGIIGLIIVSFFIFVGVFSDIIAPYPPRSLQPLYEGEFSQPPNWKHPMGTSATGICIFSEVINATRNNLLIAFSAIAMAILIAIIVGCTAGYFGKALDTILMRITEVFLVFPVFLLALVFLRLTINFVVIGYGIWIVILILGVFYWSSPARMIRGETIGLKEKDFILAAKLLGASNMQIILHHVLPNLLPIIIVVSTYGIAEIIILEAAIGFLGFGDPNTVTWGLLLQEGYLYMWVDWWTEVFPGLTLFLFVLGCNLFGDGLQDALNPRLRK